MPGRRLNGVTSHIDSSAVNMGVDCESTLLPDVWTVGHLMIKLYMFYCDLCMSL